MRSGDIVAALTQEREYAGKGLGFRIADVRQEEGNVVIAIEPLKGGRSTAVDESLEGWRAVWGKEQGGRGEVFVASPETSELVVRFPQGPLPIDGEVIWLYPRDFLTPLINLWSDGDSARKGIKLLDRRVEVGSEPEKPLRSAFGVLRERQVEAVQAALCPVALIIGPPGTGKTFTVGAMIANLMTRFVNSRVLLMGPTNVAVDTALIAADDWLQRLGREDVRATLKRIGSRFNPRKYEDREHLLAPGIFEAAAVLSVLELEEPPRADTRRYVAWKEKVERARAALKSDVAKLAGASRLIAVTTASAFIWYEAIRDAGTWHVGICDESSQIIMPAALMLGALSKRSVFAGDPNQLAPIVQNPDRQTREILTRTAFDMLPHARRVQLNEQSRMCQGICDAISHTFYDGDLKVCRRASKDRDWKKARAPWYIGGREVPRIMFDERAGESNWSNKYNGPIRFGSAKIVEALANELLGSYVDVEDMLVLTPFRAQRALIRTMFRRARLQGIRVSTVHRSQGTESKIVIFDPVDAAGSFLNSDDGRRLINVALSRAQAHALITINAGDLHNPWLRKIYEHSRALWHTSGAYALPFQVALTSD